MIQWTNIGLWGEFEPCERGILEKLNQNFELLDALTQMTVMGFVTSLPLAPGIGDRYILEDDSYIYSEYGSDIIVWDGEVWLHIEAREGYVAYVMGATPGSGKFYWFDGTSWKIQEGGGGSVRNYFPNPDFANGLDGVTLYEETAGYVDGQGGAPTITVSIDTVTPISGDDTLRIQKPVGSKINQGVSFDSENIDVADQGGDFYVDMTLDLRGANYNAGDIELVIYDETNAVIVVPDYVRDVVTQASLSTLDGGIFRVRAKISALSSTNLRASLNIDSTNALAWDIGVDSVIFSPEATATTLNELGDVTITLPTTGQILTWNGSQWVNLGNPAITALTGDVTATGPGSVAATIALNAVTNAKAAKAPARTFKGNPDLTTEDVEDMTTAIATSLLDVFQGDIGVGGAQGLVPAPAAGDGAANKILGADGTWVTAVQSVNGQSGVVNLTTTNVPEGTKLYYTEPRFDASIALTSIDELSDVDTSTIAPVDGDALVYSSVGTKWQPGAGGSGSGLGSKNYSFNSGFEKNIQSIVPFKEAPYVDGVGGSPTQITVSQSAVSPIAGLDSLLVTVGASAIGEGISFNQDNGVKFITIDAIDRGKLFKISQAIDTTDVNFVSGFLKMYVYDVTNSAILPINDNFNSSGSMGILPKMFGTFEAYVQIPANCQAIRVSHYHEITNGAATYTYKVDESTWGPASLVSTGTDTDWLPYTPIFTNLGAPTGLNAVYKFQGSDVLIDVRWVAGTPSPSEGRLSLPSGLLSASTLAPISLAGIWSRTASGAEFDSVLKEPGVNYVTFAKQNNSAGGLAKLVGSSMFTSTEVISVQARIPIQGRQSSQSTFAANANLPKATGKKTSGSTSGAAAIANLTSVSDDIYGAMNATTGVYTVKVAGDYDVFAWINWTSSSAVTLSIIINGAVIKYGGASSFYTECNGTFPGLKVGDTIAIGTSTGSPQTIADFRLSVAMRPNGMTGLFNQTQSALIGNAGSASIASQNGSWIASVSRTGTGTVLINFIPGFFAAPPFIQVSAIQAMVANTTQATVSSVTIGTRNTSGVLSDSDFYITAIAKR